MFIIAAISVVYINVSDSPGYYNGDNASGSTEGGGREQNPCEDMAVREDCSFVEIDGESYRYSLIRAAKTTRETVIVDLGGPGISILNGSRDLSSFSGESEFLRDKNLLFIEEPWVGKEPEEECQSALFGFYETARTEDDILGAARAIQQNCKISSESDTEWGFSEGLYHNLVTLISQKEGVGVNGFFGYSFASVRASYIDLPLDWAVFVKPYPVGVPGNEIVSERQSVLSGSDIINEEDLSSVQIEDRFFPVDQFDYATAEVALGYLSGEQLRAGEDALRNQDNPALIGELSDSLWMRYGVSSISPGYLAYLQEVCQLGSDWEDIGSDRQIDSSGILSRIHSPCVTDTPARPMKEVTADSICIISSDQDPVAPGNLLSRSAGFKGEVIRVEANTVSHSANEDVDTCFAQVEK